MNGKQSKIGFQNQANINNQKKFTSTGNVTSDDKIEAIPFVDAYPNDASKYFDLDNDDLNDFEDDDIDGDGISNFSDDLPYDFSETIDSDGDGIGNNADLDDDRLNIETDDELRNYQNAFVTQEITKRKGESETSKW